MIRTKSFNLVTEPWIQVLTKHGETELVSLNNLFANSQKYYGLAGEMKIQDFSIMRLLLSILHTVYSRYDADGEPYNWLNVNDKMELANEVDDADYGNNADDLLTTWQTIRNDGQFSEVVIDYLQAHINDFDFFGDKPFYQVNAKIYDSLVPDNKKLSTETGTITVKQIDRTLSESNNKASMFAQRQKEAKNDISLDKLIRWVITYHNYSGVTEKTRVDPWIDGNRGANAGGWDYDLSTLYASGNDLFDILTMNMIMLNGDPNTSDFDGIYENMKPFWEYSTKDYLNQRRQQIVPDNKAELYTLWSRMLHIEWTDNKPTIYSAALPKVDFHDKFNVEPMTTWNQDNNVKGKDVIKPFKPTFPSATKSGQSLWRNFGLLFGNKQEHKPGILNWLNLLISRGLVNKQAKLSLASLVLISDGNASSKLPANEIYGEFHSNADVLFDNSSRWIDTIMSAANLADDIGAKYRKFLGAIAYLRAIGSIADFTTNYSTAYFEALNQPFNNWLNSLTDDDDRDIMLDEWKHTVYKIAIDTAKEFMRTATNHDARGNLDSKNNANNIYSIYNRFHWQVYSTLWPKGEHDDK